MLIRCGLFLLALNCVGTTKYVFDNENYDGGAVHFSYSNWPSVYNAAKLMRVRKREAQAPSPTQPVRQSEGGPLMPSVPLGVPNKTEAAGNASVNAPVTSHNQLKNGTTSVVNKLKDEKSDVHTETDNNIPTSPPAHASQSCNVTATALPGNVSSGNITEAHCINGTNSEEAVNALNINNPGVVKRAAIVFGGFLLLAVAYFIFYRKKGDKHNANTNGMGDVNQFRYGVLESEDRSGKMELSRVPLTMESDEDEDEDLEIFDLGQKNSQSYVNLQTKDEDLVFNSMDSQKDDKDTLLLEIEDGPSDTLINWTNNGNKSIL